MEHVKQYINEHKDRFLHELFGLIRIPSISSVAENKDDMIKAAEYWRKSLREAGCDKTEIFSTDGNPIVYGEKIIDPALPTILVVGHLLSFPNLFLVPAEISPLDVSVFHEIGCLAFENHLSRFQNISAAGCFQCYLGVLLHQ